jgi:hypothetical protein
LHCTAGNRRENLNTPSRQEEIMTYVAHARDFHSLDAGAGTAAAKPGVLRRLVRAFTAWRQREADREIARFLARSGGRFNDDLERELMRRVATRDWDVSR